MSLLYYLVPPLKRGAQSVSAIDPESTIPTCDALLDAEEFDPALFDALTTRLRYPFAARYLQRTITGSSDDPRTGRLVSIIVRSVGTNLLPFRVALFCQLIDREVNGGGVVELVTVPTIQQAALSSDETESRRGHLAAALCGEPLHSWREMPRKERAAYALHQLVVMMVRRGFVN